MSFADRMKTHLAAYKQATLGVSEDGLWARNRRPYPHILPKDRKELNILEPFREAFWKYATESRISLHTDFHHLNSSQALAFNLFYPALEDRTAHSSLTSMLAGSPTGIASWQFEAVPDPDEGTNFDLLLVLETGGRVYVEVKFTELSFGTCTPDETHLRKRERIYRPRLGGIVDPGFLEGDRFFGSYQLFRNLSYLQADQDRVIFVVPQGNQPAADHASLVFAEALLPAVTGAHLITVEQVIDTIGRASVADGYRRHYQLFAEKYLPTTARGAT